MYRIAISNHKTYNGDYLYDYYREDGEIYEDSSLSNVTAKFNQVYEEYIPKKTIKIVQVIPTNVTFNVSDKLKG